ncbi:SafA/ExsA family spore coat assembly protein [Lentibacillus sp. N15]|uniref:SafA/ExsA family spore coat assembly protein n=1 Tax=Lentibacillus songyuanensis TaxID=3136161 RepID=UPI0031BB0AA2
MKIHVVQKGDTLWELAKKYGVDFEEVKQLNPQLSSPDMIMPGMKIKIPGSNKAVQKEGMKETQKPAAMHPYKEMPQPKPVPVIKEDVKEKQKPVQPHMPMQPQMPKPQPPVAPQMPAPQQSVQQMQPIIQMPIMEQELKNYTSVTIPEMPHYEKPKEQPKKHEMPKHQPMHQPMPQPMPQPVAMMPMCCHFVHPCGHPMPPQEGCFPVMGAFDGGQMPHHPMHQPHHHYEQKMESSSWEMPIKAYPTLNDKDCGCNGKSKQPSGYPMYHKPMHEPSHGQMQPFPGHMGAQPYGGYPTHPAHAQTYPSHWSMPPNHQPFPTPPGYPNFSDYRTDEDESLGE